MSKDCIEELERQCDAQLAELEAISEALGTNEGHSSVDHIVALREQLAAALAACKVKDEALGAIPYDIDDGMFSRAEKRINESLAIQPDDSALKAWLGEPVAFMAADQGGVHLSIDADKFHSWLPLFSAMGKDK